VGILRNYTVTPLPSYKCCPLKGDRLLVTIWAIVLLVKHPSVTATISWLSCKQGLVAFSTTEAEYIACSDATREAEWLARLHKDVTSETVVPTIYCNSNGTLKTIYSGVSSPKTKYIDIRYHISRDRQ